MDMRVWESVTPTKIKDILENHGAHIYTVSNGYDLLTSEIGLRLFVVDFLEKYGKDIKFTESD